MKRSSRYLAICALTMGLGAFGIGTAMSAPPADRADWGCGYGHGPGFGPGGGPGMGRNWDNGQFGEQMKQRISQRHAALHDRLKLDERQEAAWQAYTAATMKNMTPPSWNYAEMSKLTAPERMEKMLQRMKEHEQQMSAQLEATKTFYATLTPEQQKIFDAEWGAGRPRSRRNVR